MKRNIIEIVFLLIIIIGIGFTFYDIFKLNQSISHNERIVDSLKVELNKHQIKYDSLYKVLTTLDSTVSNQEERVKIIKQSFYYYKTPPIYNSDSATKYLKDFIRD